MKVTLRGLRNDSNGSILVRHLAFVTEERTAALRAQLLSAASRSDLGQQSKAAASLRGAALARRRAAVARFRGTREIAIMPEWRIVTGLGDEGPQEIGIALHGTYGWPVLPASGLKGLARRWAIENAEDDTAWKRIFGTAPTDVAPGKVGTVTFFDAIPGEKTVKVELDVVTVHHGAYYRRHATSDPTRPDAASPPAGIENPVPVTFLTVGRGNPQKNGCLIAVLTGPEADVETAATWVRDALSIEGFGAKTAGGYGYVEGEGDG
ncbi:type III-B CRISPR module RAMP protein Cmr6 [Microbacterium sp.]|uniref:type III-B CRISPR module RAMP protein Cmr6 n=1 Tax=Microbacterium sp. TaxID=51671 RepID=UPI003A879EC2